MLGLLVSAACTASVDLPTVGPPVVTFGGRGDDVVRAVAIDENGDLYIAGHFDGPTIDFKRGENKIELVNRADGTRDGFVARIDGTTGETTWARSIGGDDTEVARAIAVTSNQVCFAVNTNSAEAWIDGASEPLHENMGGYDSLVACLFRNDGVLMWHRAFGGTDYDSVTALTFDAAGDLYLTGDSESSSPPFCRVSGPPTNTEGYLFKLDGLSGDCAWSDAVAVSSVTVSLQVDGDALYTAVHIGLNSAISQRSATDGKLNWSIVAGGGSSFIAGFTITPDGLRFVGNYSGMVTLFDDEDAPEATSFPLPVNTAGNPNIYVASTNRLGNVVREPKVIGSSADLELGDIVSATKDGSLALSLRVRGALTIEDEPPLDLSGTAAGSLEIAPDDSVTPVAHFTICPDDVDEPPRLAAHRFGNVLVGSFCDQDVPFPEGDFQTAVLGLDGFIWWQTPTL